MGLLGLIGLLGLRVYRVESLGFLVEGRGLKLGHDSVGFGLGFRVKLELLRTPAFSHAFTYAFRLGHPASASTAPFAAPLKKRQQLDI